MLKVLILGASYGSLLGTKIAMAGHDVTLVCRPYTVALINAKGTEVRLKLRDEEHHRSIRSPLLPGQIDAATPEQVDPSEYDLVALAMQEPQCCTHAIRTLLMRVAMARVPCLSIMNMPPLAYLRRIPRLETEGLAPSYLDPRVWERFEPGLMSLCSPDPQAFRPPEEDANVLHVGLPTNFKAAHFDDPRHTRILERLAADIDAVRLDGKDVPVKLRVHESLYVPLAKWAMLLTGNYRCILDDGARPIHDAVHEDLAESERIYAHVAALVRMLGAEESDQVPFQKYARAAESLVKPSSAARAILAGSPVIERVDKLVQLIARQYGMGDPAIDRIVATVDSALAGNRVAVA